ncbi:hypothetical protein F5X99DRAFT_387047 [Biscogniauxia marginata]|nr:hypothetical protein F5X99DRAFT_387047 [Biscogniauxia marginata]
MSGWPRFAMANAREKFLEDDHDAISSWYLRPGTTQADIAKEAYEDAVQYLKREFTGNPKTLVWINAQISLTEVLVEVETAERMYRTRRDGQVVIPCLRRLSSSIMLYSQVFDVLAQHHSEYVSLAWGALKFILMGILNHEELVNQFSTALAEIADVLPRAEVIAELFRTDRVKATLSRVYAHVLLFLRQAVKWYAHSSAGRAICSIFKPFPLKCERFIEQIRACVKSVGEEASVASQVEIRGLHVESLNHGRRLTRIEKKLDEWDRVHTQKLDIISQNIVEVQSNSLVTIQKLESSNTALGKVHVDTQEIKYKVTDVQAVVRDRTRIIQYEEVIKSLAPKTLPEDALRKQHSFSRRAGKIGGQARGKAELIRRLDDWVLPESPPLLVMHIGPRAQAQARELATELIDVLQSSVSSNVCWYLQAAQKEEPSSGVDILRSLIFQLMRLGNSNGIGTSTSNEPTMDSDTLDLDKFQNSHTEAEWLEILSLIVRRSPRWFFFIECNGLQSRSSMGAEAAGEWLAFFNRIIESCRTTECDTRLLVMSSCDTMAAEAAKSPLGSVAKVQWSAPPPPRLRHLAIRPRSENTRWIGVKKRVSDARKG